MSETTISLILLVSVAAVVFIVVLIKSGRFTKRGESGISAKDVAAVGIFGFIYGFFVLLKKIFSALKKFFQNFGRKIWYSKHRWWWIGIIAFLVFSYTRAGYMGFFTDEGKGVKTAAIQHKAEGIEFIFDLPKDLKRQRIEIVEGVKLKTDSTGIVSFTFPNAVLCEFYMPIKFLYKIMPKKNSEMQKFKNQKSARGHNSLYKNTEIEWSKPPYVLIAGTNDNKPLQISSNSIKYRILD